MTITKMILANDRAKVDYSTDAGEFKISLDSNLATLDLIKSIGKLADIFASRLELDDLNHKAMTLPSGVETGEDDEGVWYRVHGTYTANNITYKLQTGKMHECRYEMTQEQDIEDYPYLLSDEELELITNVLQEATLFVDGKRKEDPQGELFEELTSKTVGALGSLVKDAKAQGATVSWGGVEL